MWVRLPGTVVGGVVVIAGVGPEVHLGRGRRLEVLRLVVVSMVGALDRPIIPLAHHTASHDST